jgi:hypothetical protein
MTNKIIVAVALVVIAIIAIGGYSYPSVTETVVERTVGAVVGPDTYFPYVANNDVQEYSTRQGLNTATTTVCSIKSPAATSTLRVGAVTLTTSSTTASIVTLAKATTAYATTTALSRLALAANAQATHFASTSAGSTDIIFSPNTYFVVGMEGGAGTFSPVGACTAVFTRI